MQTTDDTQHGEELEVVTVGSERLDEVLALFQQTWWTQDRAPGDVSEMLRCTPVNVGLHCPRHGGLVAYARAFTDGVYKALVMDVVVDESLRGRGSVGTRLMIGLLAHPRMDVPSVELYCHPNRERFYRSLGFDTALVGGGEGAGTVQTLMRRAPARRTVGDQVGPQT